MGNTTIAIGADHAGFNLKKLIINHLEVMGYVVQDYGCFSEESIDYPDYAHKVATAVTDGSACCGILICGSGNGVCITANKHAGVRAALCWEPEISSLAKQHNNANVICLPARFISQEKAFAIVDAYLNMEFEGGRHAARVDKIENC